MWEGDTLNQSDDKLPVKIDDEEDVDEGHTGDSSSSAGGGSGMDHSWDSSDAEESQQSGEESNG